MARSKSRWLLPMMVMTAGALTACADSGSAPPQTSAKAPSSVTAPSFERKTSTEAPSEAKPSAASAKEVTGAKETAEPEEAEEATPEPLPEVDITNIGMHIGGEKNTAAQKAPIRDDVKKQYDALRRCYADEKDPSGEITLGVDIRIDREGGKAKISHPRSGFDNKEVTACMVKVFEGIEFSPPVTKRAMMVSFSLRFRKK